jgi:hypothetical protein
MFAFFLLFVFLKPAASVTTLPYRRATNYETGLTIRVSADGWGEGRVQDIEKVLYSAASEIVAYVPSKQEISIIVRHAESHPVTLYKRGPNGEFIVLLSAKDRYWAKYSHQFSHEFCHVLAMNSKVKDDPNQWFEESLGETASMFALTRMATTWRTSPPYPNWKDYGPALRDYAQNLINENHRRLRSETTLAEWFEENEASLRANPYLREKDELVANQLLALFEKHPDDWGAVTYLNMSRSSRTQTFKEYLRAWHDHVPRRVRRGRSAWVRVGCLEKRPRLFSFFRY